jgi:MoxR-vWA-beta-propeller ternary system domain bpX2
MAEYIENDIVFWLKSSVDQKEFLGQIRHWTNLKMAIDGGFIWIKNFTEEQSNSVEIKTIPFAQIFVDRNGLLFLKGSGLPSHKTPNLLWTPIERALPIEKPSFNHNFFGITQKLELKLVPSQNEKQTNIILVESELLEDFILKTSSIRLQNIKWVIANNNKVLLSGIPLLPLNGAGFWQKGNMIYPVGFSLEFEIFEDLLSENLTQNDSFFVWWQNEFTYSLISIDQFKPLSISSWRQSFKTI